MLINGPDIKETIGITCTFGSVGEVFACTRINRVKKSVQITESLSFKDREALFNYLHLHVSIPLALHVQGKGVLIKQAVSQGTDMIEDIHAVFPNYNEEDYVYAFFLQENTTWFSLSRRELLRGLLSAFSEEGLQVQRVFLGPALCDSILDQLNYYDHQYQFDGHYILRDAEKKLWSQYLYDQSVSAKYKVRLQGVEIGEQYIMPYAAAFLLMMHNYVVDVHWNDKIVDQRFQEFLQARIFRARGFFLLALLFILLLINTLIHTSLTSRLEAMDVKSRQLFSNASEIDQMVSKSDKGDSLLTALGWNGGVKKSWMLNQLAASIEGVIGVQWETITFNPVEIHHSGGNVVESDNRYKIEVQGSSIDLSSLEKWIRRVSALDWITQVEVNKFVEDKKVGSNAKDFMITVYYSYEF